TPIHPPTPHSPYTHTPTHPQHPFHPSPSTVTRLNQCFPFWRKGVRIPSPLPVPHVTLPVSPTPSLSPSPCYPVTLFPWDQTGWVMVRTNTHPAIPSFLSLFIPYPHTCC